MKNLKTPKIYKIKDMNDNNIIPKQSDFLLYNSPEGGVNMDVFVYKETVWLTQQKMAELFGKSQSTISEHINNIYSEGELEKDLTLAKFGNSENSISKPNYYYNLDVIISVGYRVNSKQATHFRKWATFVLRSHMVEGYTINKKRLSQNYKNFLKAVEEVKKLFLFQKQRANDWTYFALIEKVGVVG